MMMCTVDVYAFHIQLFEFVLAGPLAVCSYDTIPDINAIVCSAVFNLNIIIYTYTIHMCIYIFICLSSREMG